MISIPKSWEYMHPMKPASLARIPQHILNDAMWRELPEAINAEETKQTQSSAKIQPSENVTIKSEENCHTSH